MSEPRDPRAETLADGPRLARDAPTLGVLGEPQAETLAVGPPAGPPIAGTLAAETLAGPTALLPAEAPGATMPFGAGGEPISTELGETLELARREAPTEQGTAAWEAPPVGDAAATEGFVPARPAARGIGAGSAILPGYAMIAEIGRGGMGVVYKAHHARLDRIVALKMVLAGAHASGEMLERFHIEAKAVAQLQHPGIVQIHEVGEHGGLPYFSLEFVEGGSLAQRIDGKPQPPAEAASMVRDLALAMHEAHKRGIIHRDLKPANVLLTLQGSPKVTDFGLAKRMEADSGQTRSGAIMGTPSYMSPEQAWGRTHEIGPLTDQYALGTILYEMLVGRPPFQGATALETLELARTQEPVAPTRLQPKVPIDLETICLKALQKEPAKRYADVAELAGDLGRFLEGRPILARPVGAPERLARWCRRNPRVAALAATVAALLVTVTAVSSASAVKLSSLNDQLVKSNGSEKKAKEAALRDEQAARAAEQASRVAEQKALAARDEAERQKAIANSERDKAEERIKLAIDQNKRIIQSYRYQSVLINQRLKMFAGSEGVRDELIRTAAEGLGDAVKVMEKLGEVGRDREADFLARKTLAGMNQQAGRIMDDLGRFDEATRYFRKMDELVGKLADEYAEKPEMLTLQAVSKNTLGEFELRRLFDSAAAIRHYEQVLDFRRRYLATGAQPDEAKRGVCNALGALANARLQVGDAAGARGLYREEAELRDQIAAPVANAVTVRRERAGLEVKLGDLAVALDDLPDAQARYEQALRLRDAIAAENPNETQARRDVLISYQNLGLLRMLQFGDPSGAVDWFEKARGEFDLRRDKDPQATLARDDAARIRYFLGTAKLRQGDRKGADEEFRASLAIRELSGVDPKVKKDAIDLMLALARCGQVDRAAKLAAGLLQEGPVDPLVAYNAACGYALCAGSAAERPEAKDQAARFAAESIKALKLSVDKGWKGFVEARTDPDLDPIRPDPGFPPLLDAIRKAAGR